MPSAESPTPTPYDEVVYPCRAYAATHPERLAALAVLFGLRPAPPEGCRFLEIGCGDGTNVLPMAERFPQSWFHGIDLAATSIAGGRQLAGEADIRNAQLDCLDLAALPAEGESFDYIVAHGVFSWVPEELREHLLGLIAGRLAPNGVAFVSYNAYPGHHIRDMLREALLYHTARAQTPAARLEQGRALAGLIADGARENDEFSAVLKRYARQAVEFLPSHFYHDDLAPEHRAFYFHEFIGMAEEHGLRFLSEAALSSMQDFDLAPEARRTLDALRSNPVLHGQYVDFLKCRRFRQTLLCHAAASPGTAPDPGKTRTLFASLPPSAQEGAAQHNGEDADSHPVVRSLLARLHASAPGRVQVRDLINEVRSADDFPESLIEMAILEMATRDLAELFASPTPFAIEAGAFPALSALARAQLRRASEVTSRHHATIRIADEAGRALACIVDGSRDRTALEWEMAAWATTRGEPSPDAFARNQVAEGLRRLAMLGLLVA